MLRMELLPAGHGDCLWIEYGDAAAPHRILIDGGASGTHRRALRERLRALPASQRQFELLVVTHVDADHIGGTLQMLADDEVAFSARDVWFNGYRHLPDENPDTLGPVQGEKLTVLLRAMPWNRAFGGKAVVVTEDQPLPTVALQGGAHMTLLSPTLEKLAALKPEWENEVRKAGLQPGVDEAPAQAAEGFELLGVPDVEALAARTFNEDSALANGSSIALLLEYEGRRLLLAGDAHPGVMTAAIRRAAGRGRLKVDACKLPHHGSKANVSKAFLQSLDCGQWLFSSNGAYFKHPDPEAVARVIKWGGASPQLVFNYRSPHTTPWAAGSLQQQHGYRTVYPQGDGEDGVSLNW